MIDWFEMWKRNKGRGAVHPHTKNQQNQAMADLGGQIEMSDETDMAGRTTIDEVMRRAGAGSHENSQ